MNTEIKNESNERRLDSEAIIKLLRDKECRDYLIAVISSALKMDKSKLENIAFKNSEGGGPDLVMENEHVVVNIRINEFNYEDDM